MNIKHIIPNLIIILIVSSCSLIFEEDISDSRVVVLTPVDGLITEDQNLKFWWEHVDYSVDYNLQIVSGDFSSPIELILDSLIAENKFNTNVGPGDYEWRIRALNYNSTTVYTTGKLTVQDTTTNAAFSEVLHFRNYEE